MSGRFRVTARCAVYRDRSVRFTGVARPAEAMAQLRDGASIGCRAAGPETFRFEVKYHG
jgi:hypothetical protein